MRPLDILQVRLPEDPFLEVASAPQSEISRALAAVRDCIWRGSGVVPSEKWSKSSAIVEKELCDAHLGPIETLDVGSCLVRVPRRKVDAISFCQPTLPCMEDPSKLSLDYCGD